MQLMLLLMLHTLLPMLKLLHLVPLLLLVQLFMLLLLQQMLMLMRECGHKKQLTALTVLSSQHSAKQITALRRRTHVNDSVFSGCENSL